MSILKVNTIQDKGGNNLLVSDGAGTISSGGAITNTPAWIVYQGSTNPTGLAFNTYHTFNLDNVDVDTHSGFNTSTYKYTVPQTGKYFMSFQYGVESVSGSPIITVMAEIYNQTTSRILLRRRTVSAGDHASTNQPLVDSIAGLKSLSANDIIYCRVYVFASSGSLKLNGNDNQEWGYFSGMKVIGA